MAESSPETGFDFHRRWVEKIIETPSPAKRLPSVKESLLTEHLSPTEHVLRGSRSFAARSLRSRNAFNGSRIPSTASNNENASVSSISQQPQSLIHAGKPILGDIANNGQIYRPGLDRLRPSPTPSLKRKKAEAIVKAHGSPTHLRVTAGGRIVPREQSPLCLPRFGYSAIKANGGLIKFAPNHQVGKAAQWTQTAQDGTQNGFVAQDIEGRLCQIVNGTILPLTEVDGALRLYMPAPNINITHRGPSLGQTMTPFPHAEDQDVGPQAVRTVSQTSVPLPIQPSVAAQSDALELEYSKLEHELRDLDKTEVIHGRTMSRPAKDALVSKRRELVVTMDNVRKALKALKQNPLHEGGNGGAPAAPTHSNHYDRVSVSPRITATPGFALRVRPDPAIPDSQGPFFHPGYPAPAYFSSSSMPFAPSYAYPGMPGHEGNFAIPPLPMPVSLQPPQFDGPPGFAPPQVYQHPAIRTTPASSAVPDTQAFDERDVPQSDGNASIVDFKLHSPRLSHALPLKDPETRKVVNIKSLLNPMSPVYKPSSRPDTQVKRSETTQNCVRNRVPTPLGFPPAAANQSHKLSPNEAKPAPSVNPKTVNSNSSVSSIKTADFFPRNTRDYSMRKSDYPIPVDSSEDKENQDPQPRHRRSSDESLITPSRTRHNTNWNPEIPDGAFADHVSPQRADLAPPLAPPGTPIAANNNPSANCNHIDRRQSDLKIDDHLPNRDLHNLSPKTRRHWRFVEEHPSQYSSDDVSSVHSRQNQHESSGIEATPAANLDFSIKPREWIEGYQAGLNRKPVGADRMGDFLDGYCSGLMKSRPAPNNAAVIESKGSPVKPFSRRPSAVQMPTEPAHVQPRPRQELNARRPTIETSMHSLDTFKQAVSAPHNEDAILTPAMDGPTVTETSLNLGAWQKHHEAVMASRGNGLSGFPFPERNSSLSQCQVQSNGPRDSLTMSRQCSAEQPSFQGLVPSQDSSYSKSPAELPSNVDLSSVAGSRIGNLSHSDQREQQAWRVASTHRVVSPTEWRCGTSVVQAASLTMTGLFTHAQFDGQRSDRGSSRDDGAPMLAKAAGIAGVSSPKAGDSRFKEASLDGLSPTASLPPTSPLLSPQISPKSGISPNKVRKVRDSPKKESLSKGFSPAKVKFDQIASKVGIKPSSEKKEVEAEPVSPSIKPRWRDLWKGARKDSCKDEGA